MFINGTVFQDPTKSAVRVAPTSRGICGRQSGTGTSFFSKYFGFPLTV